MVHPSQHMITKIGNSQRHTEIGGVDREADGEHEVEGDHQAKPTTAIPFNMTLARGSLHEGTHQDSLARRNHIPVTHPLLLVIVSPFYIPHQLDCHGEVVDKGTQVEI